MIQGACPVPDVRDQCAVFARMEVAVPSADARRDPARGERLQPVEMVLSAFAPTTRHVTPRPCWLLTGTRKRRARDSTPRHREGKSQQLDAICFGSARPVRNRNIRPSTAWSSSSSKTSNGLRRGYDPRNGGVAPTVARDGTTTWAGCSPSSEDRTSSRSSVLLAAGELRGFGSLEPHSTLCVWPYSGTVT